MALLWEALGEFVGLTLRVSPFLIFGAAAGAALQTFLSTRWATGMFDRRFRGSLPAAVAAGALLPGCSCATMPMAAGLARSGNPRLGTVAAFIFVSPLLSPVTVVLTWAMLGWRMTAARTVASVAGALLLGAILNRFEDRFAESPRPTSAPIAGGAPPGLEASCARSGGPRAPLFGPFTRNLAAIVRSVAPYFLLGMAIAAVLSTVLPEQAIPRFLGGSAGVWAYVLAAVIGIPLYVCEGEEVPLTYALIRHGLGAGPSLTFLLGSVGTCVPTVLMSRKVIGSRATAFYVAFWFAFAIGSGMLFETLAG